MFKMIKRMSFVVGILLFLVLGLSYGAFIYTSNSYRATEMLVNNLTYGIDITSSDATVSGKSVTVSSGTTAVVYLKVTSLNKVDTKYGVDYKITKGTGTVKYASNTGWLPTGKINKNNVGTYEKVIKVIISATTDMSVDFTVTGGFTNNELTEVANGYTRITEKADNVISYNDKLTNVVEKETTNNIYGGESINNYAQYPINEDNTKNIWRILGTYNGIGTKIISNQTSTTTKDTLSTDLNSFYNTLEKQDTYILNTDKFNCTNTSCTSSSYSKVGLISTSEYEMLGGINSYLASSESYFALDNGTVKNITSGGIEETSTSSGLRPSVYLQDYVTVTGSGTVNDPFKLKLPEYAVVLNVVNGSTTLPSKMITRGENVTYEITPNTGYKLVLSSNTCSNGTLSGSTFTISNVTSAQTCTITLTPESYTLTLDLNGGTISTSATVPTVTYDSTYGNLPTPIRTGYTFSGWSIKADTKTVDLPTSTNTYNGTSIKTEGFKAGQTYYINIEKVELTSGSETQFTAGIFDYTTSKFLVRNNIPIGDNVSYTLTLPSSVNESHDIRMLVYSGIVGSAANIGMKFTNISISESLITSSTKVTTPNNHELVANWTPNKYTLTLTKGTGVGTIHYKINGANSYTSATSTQTLSVNYGSTYYYYGVASTGYTMNSCTSSSPCSGTMGTSTISKTLSATINTYKVTLNVVNGTGSTSKTVNYNTSATFTGISPNSGYSSSSPTISCTGGTLSGTTLTVSNVTSARTCTVTFNKMTLSDKLLADKTTRPGARTDFSSVLTTDNTKTLYTSTEDGTTVYYFAGNATDNWVKFGGYYWRIIRTNKDGGIRLLYNGTSTTSTDAYIGKSTFNSSYSNSMYVGYMYGTSGSLDNHRGNANNSTIKNTVDTWYQNNLNTNYTKYISTSAIYCVDRGETYASSKITYPANTRLITKKTPTYDCANSKDAFSGSNSEAKLTYPIALMTADEIAFAGGRYGTSAKTWYYYNSSGGSSASSADWWLLSPCGFSSGNAGVFFVTGNNDIGSGYMTNANVGATGYFVRPVTSLKSCVKWKSGDGSASSPYEIEETTSGC